MRLHITGASGAGTTTLGRAFGERFRCPALDTDDFYWLPTDPPFVEKRPVDQRLQLLRERLAAPDWILSGSLAGWGDPLIPLFDGVVFLSVPRDERLRRLLAREHELFGTAALLPGGPRHAEHEAFMAWAAQYETGGPEVRSRALHEAWLKTLSCPVLRIEGLQTVEERLMLVERFLPRTRVRPA